MALVGLVGLGPGLSGLAVAVAVTAGAAVLAGGVVEGEPEGLTLTMGVLTPGTVSVLVHANSINDKPLTIMTPKDLCIIISTDSQACVMVECDRVAVKF
jgi:hypothetical protein